MNKTPIPWVKNPDGTQGYTWNPITGCLNNCSYCFARRLANTRLKERYLANQKVAVSAPTHLDTLDNALNDPFYPRFWPEKISGELNKRSCTRGVKAKGIFVCDMSDLFGIGIPEDWTRQVLDKIRMRSYYRFYLLTKQPQNLIKFSPFPENAWVGVTATDTEMYNQARIALWETKASVKYLSFEPLLNRINMSEVGLLNAGIKWVIIGACTGTYSEMESLGIGTGSIMDFGRLLSSGKKWTLQPKIEWVKEIVEAADKAGVKVFLKDNLWDLLYTNAWDDDIFWATDKAKLRQELPDAKR